MSVVVGRSSHAYTNVVNKHSQEQDDDESVQMIGRHSPEPSQARVINSDKDGDLTRDVLVLAATNNTPGLAGIVGLCGAEVMNRQGLWKDENPNIMNGKVVRRTPLMVAAMYGSLETVAYLIGAGVYVNTQSIDDGFTALHCATLSGSSKCVQITAVLLRAGADVSLRETTGRRAVDVMSTLLSGEALAALECMLGADVLSSTMLKQSGVKSASGQPEIEKEEYQGDEFRMFEFKVKRCPRTRAHDWTQCPFAHPGEKARRRDPRRYSYSGIACPDFRKGACPRGDTCELAHGVFECWLHPSRYRTQLCKDGMSCPRRVCFFAHCPSELRQPQPHQQLTQLQLMQGPMGAVMDQGMHPFVTLSNQAPPNFSRGNSSSESSSLEEPSPLSAEYSVQSAVPLNPIAAAYVSKIEPTISTPTKESSPDVDSLCQEVVSMEIRTNEKDKTESTGEVSTLQLPTSAVALGSDSKMTSSSPSISKAEYMNGLKGKYLPTDGKGMQKTASYLQMVEDNQCWVANMVNDE